MLCTHYCHLVSERFSSPQKETLYPWSSHSPCPPPLALATTHLLSEAICVWLPSLSTPVSRVIRVVPRASVSFFSTAESHSAGWTDPLCLLFHLSAVVTSAALANCFTSQTVQHSGRGEGSDRSAGAADTTMGKNNVNFAGGASGQLSIDTSDAHYFGPQVHRQEWILQTQVHTCTRTHMERHQTAVLMWQKKAGNDLHIHQRDLL